MKTRNKALLLSLCAVLLVATSVLGTMAYLTSTDSVKNTFTVGSVVITLDEQDVDNSTANAERDQRNSYHLMPGHRYTKDPIVHVDATSEDCWVFVKVENDIAAYEAAESTGDDAYTPIAQQIINNGWIALDDVSNVYYKEYTKNADGANLTVFENFKIADKANELEGWVNIDTESTEINVIAYAVQEDGFDTASAAWKATFGASN